MSERTESDVLDDILRLYAEAMEEGDLGTALRALELECRCRGMLFAKSHEAARRSSPGEIKISFVEPHPMLPGLRTTGSEE